MQWPREQRLPKQGMPLGRARLHQQSYFTLFVSRALRF
jgi:hypothetical protein